ncbi:DUF1801 domain-containing protein [Streptacidiphilus cavernicola]|uniref:DUF1801 domain-containing protein n=1 Tax=Streptacidiphilus cavernicola TaxID=3342716 RepID=A0ABV6W0K9_9ACTN
MDTEADAQTYIDGIAAEHRPLFDRVNRLILELHPEARPVLSYGMPTYRVGKRKLHVGVWKHGVSIYGWGGDRDAGFTSRHPELLSGKATIQLRSGDAGPNTDPGTAADTDAVTDEELREFFRAALAA